MVTIYCEKYSQAKAIASALSATDRRQGLKGIYYWNFTFKGESACIVHGLGHLVELYSAKDYDDKYKSWNLETYPIFPQKRKIKPIDSKRKCYNFIKQKFEESDWLINATDADREGELIFWYIYKSMNCKKPWKRAWISSDLTKANLIKDFNNLLDSDKMIPLYLAGECRNTDDWLYGINLTVAMTKKFSSYDTLKVLPIGRVKTPVLNLIYEREKEIENHIVKPFWKVRGLFKKQDGEEFEGFYINEKESIVHFDNENDVNKLVSSCTGHNGIVTKVNNSNRTLKKPLLYNTTKLQIDCNRYYGWSIKKATEVMQSLYEKRYMSYPRTASEHLTTEKEKDIRKTLNKLRTTCYGKYILPESEWDSFTSRHFDNAKVQSHTAIIPTLEIPDFSKLTEDERKLYYLLARSIINLIYKDAKFIETTAIVDVNGNKFKSTGKRCTNYNESWLKLSSKNSFGFLPILNVGDSVTGNYTKVKGQTVPPKHYTQASLLAVMETAGKLITDPDVANLMKLQHKGLGTDATRKDIIEGLLNQELIKVVKNSIFITDKGKYLIENLPVEELKSPELTGNLEKQLNDIATSDKNKALQIARVHCKTIKDKVSVYFEQIKKAMPVSSAPTVKGKYVCPFCGRTLREFNWGYACTGYKSGCSFTVGKEIAHKKLTEKQMEKLLTEGKTNVIKTLKNKNGATFSGIVQINKLTHKVEIIRK